MKWVCYNGIQQIMYKLKGNLFSAMYGQIDLKHFVTFHFCKTTYCNIPKVFFVVVHYFSSSEPFQVHAFQS